MKRKLAWLALAVALAVPATMAWGGEGKTGHPSCDCPVCSTHGSSTHSNPQ